MTFTFISRCNGSKRLLLLFAGWSAEPEWFDSIRPDGFDLLVVTDYRTADTAALSGGEIDGYEEIVIVSWSFGVPAATRFMRDNPGLPFTLRLAVNGTPWPVDDNLGIPVSIFQGTLDNLSGKTLEKFDRRMCGGPTALPRKRDIRELAEELKAIRHDYSGCITEADASLWDIAVIGDSDRIIPPGNQRRAWEGHARTEEIKAPHFPDFKALLRDYVVNKELVANRFGNAKESYNDNATVQGQIARHLARMLYTPNDSGHIPAGGKWLEIGAGTGLLTRLYCDKLGDGADLTLCDLSYISPDLPGEKIICDAESYIRSLPDNCLDVILGASVIQWFHSPLRFIAQCRRVLRPGGTLLLSTFAPDNFPELRSFIYSPLKGPSAAEWGEAIGKLFSDSSVEEDSIALTFTSPRQLLDHMRRTGVNGLNGDSVSSQRAVRAIMRSDMTTLTYRPIYVRATK